jgi:hypothetical protein
MLTPADRVALARELPALARRYPRLLFNEGLAQAFLEPPKNPDDCVFAKMSANYSADLESRVEPCVFGGSPDCSQCGCAASSGMHWVRGVKIAGGLKVGHFIGGSVKVGLTVNRLRSRLNRSSRWDPKAASSNKKNSLVQIQP